MRADAEVEREVYAVLERFNQAVGQRDLQTALGLFAQESDVLLVASPVGETASGRGDLLRFLTRIFLRPVTYAWEWTRREVSAAGDVAWVYVEGTVVVHSVEGERRGPYRITAVLVRHDGRWLLHQFHGSEPVHE